MTDRRTSNCASGVPVEFYWRHESSPNPAVHLDAAIAALMETVSGPPRTWSPYKERLDRAEFRKRLERACRGQLRHPDDVKSLRGGMRHLFELRWVGFNITVLTNEPGRIDHRTTDVRLITSEPPVLGMSFLGLCAHEKPHDDTAKALQDDAIDEAERIYDAGLPTQWGLRQRRRN